MLFFRKFFILLVIGAIAPLCIYAESASLLILHTNDMHDHIKKGSDGLGGVPYVAGYIASIRAQRDDIILLDGGDVMHKGDMVAYMTKSHIMYEAMRKIKYTAGVPGNHDLDGGIEQLSECAALADHPMLCLNYFDENGNLPFPPSSVVEVNGIRVGILGMTNIRSTIEKEGARLAIEAKRLDENVDLLILVAHIGSRNCTALSKIVPEIDIFVGAHTHEAISTPQVVPETQALIIEAGQYAQYVGWLEITMDMKSKKIEKYDGKLIKMLHNEITPDNEMLEWVKKEEQQYCPEAGEVVGKANRFIKLPEIASLAAAAFKDYAHADLAFCHTGQVMRSGIYAGAVDVNALFLTGGQRARDLVAFTMTGGQAEAYLAGLVQEKRGKSEWAGFQADLMYDDKTKVWSVATTLDCDKVYTVIMAEREWTQRFVRVATGNPIFQDFDLNKMKSVDFTFTSALTNYSRKITAGGETLDEHAEILMKNRKM